MTYTPVWYQHYAKNGTAVVHLRFEDGKRAVCGLQVPPNHSKPEAFDRVCHKCKKNYWEGLETTWKPPNRATMAI